MSVIKRLQRLTGESLPQPDKSRHGEKITALRRRIDGILARRPEPGPVPVKLPDRRFRPMEEVIPGDDCRNTAGSFFIHENLIDASSLHGSRRIGDFSGMCMQAASLLANDRILAGYRIEEGLFLDTETTGLAGGTGTMAFLIGVGWFDRGHFMVRQIFARDFMEERAVLTHLAEIVGARRFLFSFNGKTFDVGLLSTRYILNRLQSPFADMPHLDLLYPARRLVAHRLENCRLSTIETQVLGLIRQNDMPGSDIPQRYFDWLRVRDAGLLKDIFVHNRLDIISLAALMAHLTAMTQEPQAAAAPADARDLLAVARMYAQRKEVGRARSLLVSVMQSHECAHRMEALKMLSLLYRRAGNWDEAVRTWQEMLRDDPGNRFALIELAKWHEHRAQDPATALTLVGRALQRTGGYISDGELDALEHRQHRLQRRQEEKAAEKEH